MRKHLRRELEEPEPLPDPAINPPPLSTYDLVAFPPANTGAMHRRSASLLALAEGCRMPSEWREYNGPNHTGDTIHTASAFAGYADVLADIACDAGETPAEFDLYNVNDDGDYLADPVVVRRMGDDLVWLVNRWRFPSRVRFNRNQFGATVLAGVRQALALGVNKTSEWCDLHRSHTEAHYQYAERKLAAAFGDLPTPKILREFPPNAPLFDPDTPTWLRLHRDFPPTGEPYAELFPELEGMATPESIHVSNSVMRALSVHFRKMISDWAYEDRPLPPPTLTKLAESLDALHTGSPRWNGAWVFYLDSGFALPSDGRTDPAVVRTRFSILVRELATHLRRFAKAGRSLQLVIGE